MKPRRKFNPDLLPERPNLDFEDPLWRQGITWVAGVDEAGRGALAGPVAAGAVVLPPDQPELMLKLSGVRDSKVMSAKEREIWAGEIKAAALAWGVGMASSDEIDAVGIVPATYLAVSRALADLAISPQHVLVDYLTLPEVICPQTPLVKGDARSLSIAAAAILAKTARDAVLVELDQCFPGYSFAKNKGYGTAAHRQAIAAQGPCSQHRRTFSPVNAYDSFFPPQIEIK
ncbi:MAG: ribonuclease HII [Brevefilum sp.]|nr:ribonuclease HII [Brevefilum sp.]